MLDDEQRRLGEQQQPSTRIAGGMAIFDPNSCSFRRVGESARGWMLQVETPGDFHVALLFDLLVTCVCNKNLEDVGSFLNLFFDVAQHERTRWRAPISLLYGLTQHVIK